MADGVTDIYNRQQVVTQKGFNRIMFLHLPKEETDMVYDIRVAEEFVST